MSLTSLHYRKTLIRRVPESLRVHFIGHTAKKGFAVCLQENTRQTTNTRRTALFAVCQALAHGELQSSPCAICLAHGEHYSAVTRRLGPWQTSLFAVYLALGTRQRLCLPCASDQHTANTKKNSCFCFQMFSTLSIFCLILYVWIWYFYRHISCI